MSDSLWSHESQQARPPCPSPSPGLHSDSRPSSPWCHPSISSSVVPFFSRLQYFPASGSFPMKDLCIRWPKYWSFTFSIHSSNKYSRLMSFRIDLLDLLAVQGTLKSLQHHSSKASILWRSAFFMVQLSHPYILLEKPQLWLDGPLLDLCLKLSNSSKIGICTGSHHQLQPLIIFLYHSSVPDHSINSWLDF